jgi:bacterial/archaeal transporter family protein
MSAQSWALLSALFAGLTAVLGKKGVENAPVNLAVAARVLVVLAFAWLMAWITKQTNLRALDGKAWLFLTLSGIATGASWLCYYRALQLGTVTQVAPIDKLSFVIAVVLGVLFLKERPAPHIWGGVTLITLGVLLTLKK